MTGLSFHPIADIWPLVKGPAFESLVDDIRKNGLREPIWLHDGTIIDGRNRYRACQEIGVECPTRVYDGDDPDAFAWSLNAERRHLSESQRAMAASKRATLKPGNRSNDLFVTQEQAAELFRVSVPSIKRGAVVRDKGVPELIEAVEQDQISVSKAASLAKASPEFQHAVVSKVIEEGRSATEAVRQAKKEALPAKVASLPIGKYRVLYADPPWQYNDSRQTGDHRETTGALAHYSDMSLDELKELDVKSLADRDSVLLCWATFPLLDQALTLLPAWGFKYTTAFIWDKGHGAFGHYHDAEAELLLVAVRGSGTPDADRKEKQIQRFAREGHSRKPEQWRDLIDRLWQHGPRIELFRRGAAPDGWATWGAEAQ